MKTPHIQRAATVVAAIITLAAMSSCTKEEKPVITRANITLATDTLTPEALWAMGRIGAYTPSPDGRRIAYAVTYYSLEENRGNSVIYVQDLPATAPEAAVPDASPSGPTASPSGPTPIYLTPGSDPAWVSATKLAFLSKGEVFTISAKGKSRKQLTNTGGAVEGFLLAPDGKRAIIVKRVPFHDIIADKPADLPKTTGLVINDLMYRHWDHYVQDIPHPFIIDLATGKETDILDGQPYECPMEPFGGVEQLAWSPDSKTIALTCRVRKGLAYSISTDSDIFLYDVASGDIASARNLCKPGLTFAETIAAAAMPDAAATVPDASPSGPSTPTAPDASPTVPAAAATAPDASPTVPDASATVPDASATVPDASPSGPSTPAATPSGYNPTKSLRHQRVNAPDNVAANNPGYDQNPQFSPDGRYVAWLSMARDGYESDRQRLCVLDLQSGQRRYITNADPANPLADAHPAFDSSVDAFVWGDDSRTIYFIGVWHATENLYRTDLDANVAQLTSLQADWGALKLRPATDPGQPTSLVMERHDYFHPADLYLVTIPNTPPTPSDPTTTPTAANPATTPANPGAMECPVAGGCAAGIQQLTHENDHILSQLAPGTSEARWTTATDGQPLHYWVIKPPHFDPTKKYPTLLFCEGGPQSPVSQFWSYRWNFYIMASQGYVVIAPNRRGLPGFGQEWLEEISGDWTGQCMADYLSAIDDACNSLPYVDRDRLGAVGASFGGFSVYYLAGHHGGRFKCFITHDGAFNLEAMYTETEENWFSNWAYDDAYWNTDRTPAADRTYRNSPHLFVEQWDTPILCIHGEKDYRINATQGMSAFNAARMRGIEAKLLLFPDENHWVLKPQNGILWQRTYFDWLARWLK